MPSKSKVEIHVRGHFQHQQSFFLILLNFFICLLYFQSNCITHHPVIMLHSHLWTFHSTCNENVLSLLLCIKTKIVSNKITLKLCQADDNVCENKNKASPDITNMYFKFWHWRYTTVFVFLWLYLQRNRWKSCLMVLV